MKNSQIPELEKTCTRYLRSQKAILSPEEYQVTEKAVEHFKTGLGLDLQVQLKQLDKVVFTGLSINGIKIFL